jgi:ADP-ribosyl-[dinitrogen reductase] hydrolase
VYTNAEWRTASYNTGCQTGKTAGNGALMRTLPVALAYKGPGRIFINAKKIAQMTHWDERAGLTCAYYCMLIRYLLSGEKSKRAALKMASQVIDSPTADEWNEICFELYTMLNQKDFIPTKPTGYTVDSLVCALWAFIHHDTLEDVIVAAVNLGGDADTIAAIAGGLAGVYYGYKEIPERWINALPIKKRLLLDAVALKLTKIREVD